MKHITNPQFFKEKIRLEKDQDAAGGDVGDDALVPVLFAAGKRERELFQTDAEVLADPLAAAALRLDCSFDFFRHGRPLKKYHREFQSGMQGLFQYKVRNLLFFLTL
jgi:hypothetical protein